MEEDELEEIEEVAEITETLVLKYLKPLPLDDHNKKKRKLILANDDDDDEPGIPNGITFSESLVRFKDVKCFDDFKIQVDGLILDSEISKHLRKKYYALCVSQNKFLHENLVKGLNSKLAAGVISETINIADAIRAAKPSSALTDLESYARILKAFEELGMAVGFFQARIDKLLGLSCELQAVIESKRNELDAAEDEMRGLKAKLMGVEMLMEKLVGEIYGLKAKNKKLEVVFTDIADAPW
ncbi:B3 domain-containing protein os01g0234100 [Phtheirospermum japonicum]|uniref:B3 domain-containing protein os01g0234100 n=1 Tax=Phtheirospermum japonicum TaxID=374723 RepID=A0A830BXE5_9LAMI|nr:B3 domain-containing protein os01g0234100 [Phtheirospermum japonicum]